VSLFTSAPLLAERARVLAYPKVLTALEARGFSLDVWCWAMRNSPPS
jgi:hypothetical protein